MSISTPMPRSASRHLRFTSELELQSYSRCGLEAVVPAGRRSATKRYQRKAAPPVLSG